MSLNNQSCRVVQTCYVCVCIVETRKASAHYTNFAQQNKMGEKHHPRWKEWRHDISTWLNVWNTVLLFYYSCLSSAVDFWECVWVCWRMWGKDVSFHVLLCPSRLRSWSTPDSHNPPGFRSGFHLWRQNLNLLRSNLHVSTAFALLVRPNHYQSSHLSHMQLPSARFASWNKVLSGISAKMQRWSHGRKERKSGGRPRSEEMTEGSCSGY